MSDVTAEEKEKKNSANTSCKCRTYIMKEELYFKKAVM
jgi:hypothetical protein